MKNIVIIGAGGFGREVAWLIEDINKLNNEWNFIGFVDDDFSLKDSVINGYKVLGNVDWLKCQDLYAVCAVGDPVVKKLIVNRLNETNVKFPVLIHPSVIKSNIVEIGEGSIICAANILTVNIYIGNHVIVNLDCTIGHDVKIGDYCTILPSVNVSGFVNLGECVSVGTGTQIIQGLEIVNNTIIGAAAAVVKNITEPGTYVGIPARRI